MDLEKLNLIKYLPPPFEPTMIPHSPWGEKNLSYARLFVVCLKTAYESSYIIN